MVLNMVGRDTLPPGEMVQGPSDHHPVHLPLLRAPLLSAHAHAGHALLLAGHLQHLQLSVFCPVHHLQHLSAWVNTEHRVGQLGH